MQTKAKSNSVITHAVEGALIKFNVLGVGELALDTERLSSAVMQRAMIHGMIQRVSDAAAISRNTTTGQPASAQDKFNAMAKLVEHYETRTEDWRIAGERAERGSFLLSALCEAYPKKTREELQTWLKARTAKDRAALSVEPRIKAIIDKLTSEATSGTDTEALLSGLED